MTKRAIVFRRAMRLAVPALYYAAMAAGLSVTASAQIWSPITTLDTFAGSGFAGPIFDSFGNGWMVLDDDVNLSVVEYNVNSGTWQAPYVLGPAIPGGQFASALAADQSGNVYVVYNGAQIDSAPFPLMWAKYSPASGWQAPAVAYNSPSSYGEVMPAVDSAGHLVVVFNPSSGIASVVYDPGTSSWGRAQIVAPAGLNTLLPSMAGNTSGSRLALVYLGHGGIEYSFFDSSSKQWARAAKIPGSEKATFSGASDGSFIPISVDPSGNVTLVTAVDAGRGQAGVAGFHYEGGSWQMAQLGSPTPETTDFENFGSIAQSPSGTVLVAAPYSTGSQLSIAVFRYTPGVGWDTEMAGTLSTSIANRCRIAWFQSGEAVVAYNNNAMEDASVYSNGAWSSGPAIPGGYATFYPGMATAPNGNVLFAMTSFEAGSYGVVVTWLQP